VDALAEKYVAWSPYGFVLGNPVKLFDPDGREPDGRDPKYHTHDPPAPKPVPEPLMDGVNPAYTWISETFKVTTRPEIPAIGPIRLRNNFDMPVIPTTAVTADKTGIPLTKIAIDATFVKRGPIWSIQFRMNSIERIDKSSPFISANATSIKVTLHPKYISRRASLQAGIQKEFGVPTQVEIGASDPYKIANSIVSYLVVQTIPGRDKVPAIEENVTIGRKVEIDMEAEMTRKDTESSK
jgi:hypothetical protein